MIFVCAYLSDGVFGERLSHLLNCCFIIKAKCKQHLFCAKFSNTQVRSFCYQKTCFWGETFFNEEQN